MEGDQHNFPQDQGQTGSFFGQNVDFHPSWDCPRNFIIFDQTDNCSQVMYNPGLNTDASYFPDNNSAWMQKDENTPSVIEEDPADIDALLSFDDEDEDEEHEEASTADSSSLRRRNKCVGSTSSHGSKGSFGKREKMKKMVKSLKTIVPGGNPQMNTADVLDETVKYLKALKVEARKKEFGNLSGRK
ncbi:transcription factor bHLH144-like [Bidens hawaiensis]|uniref:transcription factor bHLH144-like n=1 Tax=Bidens hawaiensis TaxID=980011 RepID=UPI00404B66D6